MLKIFGVLHIVAMLTLSIFLFTNKQILLGCISVIAIFTGYCFLAVDKQNNDIIDLKGKCYSPDNKTSKEKIEQMQKDIFELEKKVILLQSLIGKQKD